MVVFVVYTIIGVKFDSSDRIAQTLDTKIHVIHGPRS